MSLNLIKKTGGALVLVALVSTAPAWGGGDDFVIGDARVKSGSSFSGYLKVPEKDGAGTRIPYTVIHGAKKGKVLALVAGVHAYEYPPILALYQLKDLIDPKTLSGTVLMVHIANLPSFKRRTIYYGPTTGRTSTAFSPATPTGR